MFPARARTGTARSGDKRTNHEATAPPAKLSTLLTIASYKMKNWARAKKRAQAINEVLLWSGG